MTKRIFLTTALLATLFLQSPSKAGKRFYQIGTDSDGKPYLLDTTTMGKIDKDFGKVISIYQLDGRFMNELLLRPACGNEELWLVGARVWSNGVKVSQHKSREQLPARGTSPAANAMSYYCQSIGARGW
ncbi:hypothetical protein [Nostoc sp. NIES-3756]|uniref:hypothetical protein n=1 Tax=Nostoc sp. NIES-3756 TaxID=1751286 RepID=UPI0011E05C1B|nr:hypothetical protein [Nostoc sp. NIES-3756]